MSEARVYRKGQVDADITVPPDKSITHRAIMLASLASGTSTIRGFLDSGDCRSTITVMRAMGVGIREDGTTLTVCGNGLRGLRPPAGVLDAGNSGTTVRLVSGILAGQAFEATLTGDSSLSRRPMKRIIEPLRRMGVDVKARDDEWLPLTIRGSGSPAAVEVHSPVASAQVKSCVLLAGLYAQGETVFHEPVVSRDHTERFLSSLGVPIETSGTRTSVRGPVAQLPAFETVVPGDPSSAAYFAALTAMLPGSHLTIRSICVNPTRTGFLTVLSKMGVSVSLQDVREVSGEPVAEVHVHGGTLRNITVEPEDIPSLIDEVPLLAVVATQADGVMEIRGAGELRVKESDRLAAITQELKRMGARIVEKTDGLIVIGNTTLRGAEVSSRGDHRIAMSLAIAGAVAEGETTITDAECTGISFPGFWDLLARI
jgi:3-phosphoshikimate 1-carboxyvinyltransferase